MQHHKRENRADGFDLSWAVMHAAPEIHTPGEEMCYINRWKKRIEKVRGARSAYSKALHIAPHVGACWGDAASAEWLQAQLLRAHPSLPRCENRLQVNAERLLKGMKPSKSRI